jgi:hypothetical protein
MFAVANEIEETHIVYQGVEAVGETPTAARETRAPPKDLFFGCAQFGDDAEIFQRGGVAFDFAAGGDLLEKAAHDFS